MKKAALIMGSDSDLPVVAPAVKKLRGFGVECEVHVLSAHRTPQAAANFASQAEQNGFGVIICAAGMAAHLGGVIAAHTVLPVIGIPVKSAALEGMDALLATVQMPPGVPVATVGINSAVNAAVLAAQILAVGEPVLQAKLHEMKEEMEQGVLKKDAAINEKLEALL